MSQVKQRLPPWWSRFSDVLVRIAGEEPAIFEGKYYVVLPDGTSRIVRDFLVLIGVLEPVERVAYIGRTNPDFGQIVRNQLFHVHQLGNRTLYRLYRNQLDLVNHQLQLDRHRFLSEWSKRRKRPKVERLDDPRQRQSDWHWDDAPPDDLVEQP